MKEYKNYSTLVIDDDPSYLILIEKLLISRGHNVKCLPSTGKALEEWEYEKYPLVIIDWSMPGMDGLELTREIRKQLSGDLAVIIVMTSKNLQDQLRAVISAGSDDYFHKSLDRSTLELRLEIAENQVVDKFKRKKALSELKESEERYSLAEKGANDGLWDWKIFEEIVYYSPRWKQILGFNDDELENTLEEWFDRVHHEDITGLHESLEAHLKGLAPLFENESQVLHKDGSYRWILFRGFAIKDEDDWPYRIAGSIMDITDRKKAEEKLLHDAFYDGLTELPNLKLFMDRLNGAVARNRRNDNYHYAVCFFDIDRMKIIMESLGQNVGDKIIKETGNRLSRAVRFGDTVARFSGNAFVFLIDDINDKKDVLYIIKRIFRELTNPIYVDELELIISASIGIAINESEEVKAEDIMRYAHIALNKVKEQGGNNYLIYKKDMKTNALERLSLENKLFHALKKNEFLVFYQPQVDVLTGEIDGFEALIRWQHPELGMIPPIQFIPLAEDTGLIVTIGQWILKEASHQTRKWQDQWNLPLCISINFCARQLRQEDISGMIKETLDDAGLDPVYLEIEITESALMENVGKSIEGLKKLKELGIKISIDDFGTGYSSLSYLTRLPLDRIKIDRSFINGIPDDSDNVAITKTIIDLAKNLNLSVVAEGVETHEQLDFLKKRGCETIQGFYFSKPLPPAEISKALSSIKLKKI